MSLNDIPIDDLNNPEEHMDATLEAFNAAWRKKYMKGQKEHGGMLWRKQCLPFLVEETLDFVSYIAVLAPQLKKVYELLLEAQDACNCPDVQNNIERALSILNIGNEEGIPEEEL